MPSKEEFIIPVDGAIADFKYHLESHPRTILSARFGDGKSYFIEKILNDKGLKKKYDFIKIYPVNYQVVDNKDVFELVKRDLLIQLLTNGMVLPDYEIPDYLAFQFYLQSNGMDLAETLLSSVPILDTAPTALKALLLSIKSSRFFTSISEKFKEYKGKGSNAELIESFVEKVNEETIYESDPVTALIKDSIEAYRKKTRKKIVLFFEDMDRIDPAHLFRIMNVLSAHMDYGYKYGVKPSPDSLVGNKFGVDNIVLVLDYKNLQGIFKHFYGEDACFEGYISKFSNKGYFTYSLSAEKEKYYYDYICRETALPIEIVKEIIPSGRLSIKSIRQVISAIDGSTKQIISVPQLSYKELSGQVHPGLLKLMVILRRLGVVDTEIAQLFSDTVRKLEGVIYGYILAYAFARKKSLDGTSEDIMLRYDASNLCRVSLNGLLPNGMVTFTLYHYVGKVRLFDFQQLAMWMLGYVGK